VDCVGGVCACAAEVGGAIGQKNDTQSKAAI
jgi:hypothetical protein